MTKITNVNVNRENAKFLNQLIMDGYTALQIHRVKLGLFGGVTPDLLRSILTVDMTSYQITELCVASIEGVNVRIFADASIDHFEMNEIKHALIQGANCDYLDNRKELISKYKITIDRHSIDTDKYNNIELLYICKLIRIVGYTYESLVEMNYSAKRLKSLFLLKTYLEKHNAKKANSNFSSIMCKTITNILELIDQVDDNRLATITDLIVMGVGINTEVCIYADVEVLNSIKSIREACKSKALPMIKKFIEKYKMMDLDQIRAMTHIMCRYEKVPSEACLATNNEPFVMKAIAMLEDKDRAFDILFDYDITGILAISVAEAIIKGYNVEKLIRDLQMSVDGEIDHKLFDTMVDLYI